MDKNEDRKLDVIEVKAFYLERQVVFSQEEISSFFIATDKDEDGLISADEYVFASLLYDDDALDLNDYKFR